MAETRSTFIIFSRTCFLRKEEKHRKTLDHGFHQMDATNVWKHDFNCCFLVQPWTNCTFGKVLATHIVATTRFPSCTSPTSADLVLPYITSRRFNACCFYHGILQHVLHSKDVPTTKPIQHGLLHSTVIILYWNMKLCSIISSWMLMMLRVLPFRCHLNQNPNPPERLAVIIGLYAGGNIDHDSAFEWECWTGI